METGEDEPELSKGMKQLTILGPIRNHGLRSESWKSGTHFAPQTAAAKQNHVRPFQREGYTAMGAKRPTKILMLVSSSPLREQLDQLIALQDEFAVERTESVQEALKLSLEDGFDIILLDVQLAEIGGHLMCRLLRSKGVNHPIIMLSSSESDAEVILGFESGATDFVAGPLNMKTFVARLRAHARQSEKEEMVAFKFGPYLFHFVDNSLIDSRLDKRVHLTLKEAMVLRYLCRHKGKAVHRDELLRKVWDWDPTSFTHTLESHIYRLRKKLEPDPRHPMFILSAPCGYQLVGSS